MNYYFVSLYIGKDIKKEGLLFWDLVVVTAGDEDQAKAYREQIENKITLHQLPMGVSYHVFHDPPGPKAGEQNKMIASNQNVNHRFITLADMDQISCLIMYV